MTVLSLGWISNKAPHCGGEEPAVGSRGILFTGRDGETSVMFFPGTVCCVDV